MAPLLNRITGIQLSHSYTNGESNSAANSNGEGSKDDTKNGSSFVFDLFAARYSCGDFLLCHDDRLSNRRIAFVYNLTEDWRPEEGGALEILETDGMSQNQKIELSFVMCLFPVFKCCLHSSYNSARPARACGPLARSRIQFSLFLRGLAHFLSPGEFIPFHFRSLQIAKRTLNYSKLLQLNRWRSAR